MKFYTYLWLREDGTPYYVGKGSGNRAFIWHRGHNPPRDKARIMVLYRASEFEAFATERELIQNWGRKDLGTGCLHNRTDGGDNPPKGRNKGSFRLGDMPVHRFASGVPAWNAGRQFKHAGSFSIGHAPHCNHNGYWKSLVCGRCGKILEGLKNV